MTDRKDSDIMTSYMISVIIPIYNNETTLRRCVDSVLAQTEPDLEILLIDDGSEDDSGTIADSYLADPRVRVFHKANGGLSSARNYGLDRANGEYIAFADADDWIEPEAYKTALSFCEDVCVFGYSKDYPGKSLQRRPVKTHETVSGEEALNRLIVDASINHGVWNKLYRRVLLEDIRFPDGAIYEDIRTIYRILPKANRIALIPDVLYHYMQYKGSLAHHSTLRNCLDHWTATYELYRTFGNKDGAFLHACIMKCAVSICRVWECLWKTDADARRREDERLKEITLFAKKYRRCIVREKHYSAHIKAAVILASFGGRWSQWAACLLRSAKRIIKPERLFERTDAATEEMTYGMER